MKPSDASEALNHIKAQYLKYGDEVTYYSYPFSNFYVNLCWPWITTQAKGYWGVTVPFVLLFSKGGTGSFELPFGIGPGENVLVELEQQKLAWVRASEKRLETAEHTWQNWLAGHPVPKDKDLSYYLALLKEAYEVFLKQHIHFQIAGGHMDRPLARKINEVFRGSGLSEQEIQKLAVSDKKADVIVHDEMLAALHAWSTGKGIRLTTEAYGQNIKDAGFKKRLAACYDHGYFLRSGYGGVVLWSMEDEYDSLLNIKPIESIVPLSLDLLEEQGMWIAIAKHLSEMRDRRKSLQQKAYYYFAQILEEAGGCVGIPRLELEYLCFEQLTPAILTSPDARKLIAEQKDGFLRYWDPEIGFKEWTAGDAASVYASIATKHEQVQQLKGQGASPGKARGRVRIILNTRLHGSGFKEGEVLVTGMTSPDFVPLMKKAAAIVTELGGITCHAAIISRELGKPCITGTKIATKVLKDGDMVEVDADKGVVRKLDK